MGSINRTVFTNAVGLLDETLRANNQTMTVLLYGGAAAVFYVAKPTANDIDLMVVRYPRDKTVIGKFEKSCTFARCEFFIMPAAFRNYLSCSVRVPAVSAGFLGPKFRLTNVNLLVLRPACLVLSFIGWKRQGYQSLALDIIRKFRIKKEYLEQLNQSLGICDAKMFTNFISSTY